LAYDEYLAERIRRVFKDKGIETEEKKMMGGICYLVDDKMCAGVINDKLMARIGPEQYDEAITMKACRPMDFTGRPMKGFVYVEADGIDMEADLNDWIQRCLDYNPLATSSKKKKKK